eukprot:scaffold297552_cov30-Tisochrysis_lutea.AAC.4
MACESRLWHVNRDRAFAIAPFATSIPSPLRHRSSPHVPPSQPTLPGERHHLLFKCAPGLLRDVLIRYMRRPCGEMRCSSHVVVVRAALPLASRCRCLTRCGGGVDD